MVGANTTDAILDGSMMVRERLNGNVATTYLVGPRGPEYRRDDQAGTVRWYCYDGLGSVLGEVAPDGTLTSTQSYDVYGAVRTSAGTATSRHKYVGNLGHPSEDATGLIYMRGRWMDPVTDRFVSEDPAYAGSNWLLYCGSNPVCYRDRTRRAAEDPTVLQVAEQILGLGFLKYPGLIGLAMFAGGQWLNDNGHQKSADVLNIVTGALLLCAGMLALFAAATLAALFVALAVIVLAIYCIETAVRQLDSDERDPTKNW